MHKEIDIQFKTCTQLSDELDFAANYYDTEAYHFLEQSKLLKIQLNNFIENSNDSENDLLIITNMAIKAQSLVTQMRQQLNTQNVFIQEPEKQQDLINIFINYEKQIANLNPVDRIQFKQPLTIAQTLIKEIKACEDKDANLRYKLSAISKESLKPTANKFSLTYFFYGSQANRQKDLELKSSKNNLQLAAYAYKLLQQLLNIFRVQQANNLSFQANNSVAKFRTNSQVLAFADGEKRRPALGSTALGFVKA